MSWELLLLRHAKSAWDRPALVDFDRPLARRGHEDAPRMAHWLRRQGLRPDVLISSPATRARQTMEAVVDAFAIEPTTVTYDSRIYEADVHTLRAALAALPPRPGCVLLVGHNPGLDDLLEWLCGGGLPYTPKGKLLTTAALARIEVHVEPQALAAGSGTLLDLIRPRGLA